MSCEAGAPRRSAVPSVGIESSGVGRVHRGVAHVVEWRTAGWSIWGADWSDCFLCSGSDSARTYPGPSQRANRQPWKLNNSCQVQSPAAKAPGGSGTLSRRTVFPWPSRAAIRFGADQFWSVRVAQSPAAEAQRPPKESCEVKDALGARCVGFNRIFPKGRVGATGARRATGQARRRAEAEAGPLHQRKEKEDRNLRTPPRLAPHAHAVHTTRLPAGPLQFIPCRRRPGSHPPPHPAQPSAAPPPLPAFPPRPPSPATPRRSAEGPRPARRR